MKTCENCKYSKPIMGRLACMGQKGMPFVRPTDSCDNWKTMKQTNADRIRAMTDEELAEFLDDVRDGGFGRSYYPHIVEDWLDWLKDEARE